MLKTITKAGNTIIRIITGILAAVFLIYAVFVLWDMYRTEIDAFASYDLLKYRPNIEEREPPYLDDLLEINPDTVGWLTIYGTNIDYPVFQGDTDMEYVNKDAYGDYSISGSIYLSVLNNKDFSDPYSLIYGHHMDNGSMFGDIVKFRKKAFFFNKNNCRYRDDEGVLIMQEQVYNLKVFAIVETDAYDSMFYRSDKTAEELPALLAYVSTKARHEIKLNNIDKVLALSTCDSAATEGRIVLLCRMKLRTDPLPTREEEPLTPHRKALGHPMAGAYWAIMNLLCLLLIIYMAFPAHILIPSLRKEKPWTKGAVSNKTAITYIILTVLVFLSVILFHLTEDLHRPMQVIDRYTPIMILIAGAVWYIRRRIWITRGRSND